MKHIFSASCFLTLAVSSATAAVDPALLGLVMPEAKIVAGVQVEQSQASSFGRYLLSQIQPGPEADKFVAATGFDPRRDLREIVAASTGDQHKGIILGRGVFQPAKISTVATLAGATVSNYRGIEIITGKDAAGSLAFLDASTVAIGDPANVTAAIDRRAAGASFSGALEQKSRDVALRNDVWIATVTPLSDLAAGRLPASNSGLPQAADLFQSVQQLYAGLKFGSATVTLTGEALTRSGQDAQALADVLRFLASMVQVNRGKPGADKASVLVDAARFSAEGSTMRLIVELTEQQAEQLIAPPARPRRAAAAR